MDELQILAIIPARGGSERVPRKNVLVMSGKPLIAWTIEAALNSKAVTRTVVSTDDMEISRVSKRFGAEVIQRPEKISGPKASSESALVHAMEFLTAESGYLPDLIVFLQATSPLRAPNDIDNAVQRLIERDADSLCSVAPVPGPGFLWKVTSQSAMPWNYDPANRPRSQDMAERVCAENGSIYVLKPHILVEFGARLGGKIAVYEQPLETSFDIDQPREFAIVERLLQSRIFWDGKTV